MRVMANTKAAPLCLIAADLSLALEKGVCVGMEAQQGLVVVALERKVCLVEV